MWQVVGHEQVVGALAQGLRSGRLAHAYLLMGPAHVGKMTLALELAKALNCTGPEPPCGECRDCRRIARGLHADVRIIDVLQAEAAGGDGSRVDISIDQVREAQHQASLKPYEGRCRVFIINGAEHMSRDAANALLKTLEEPPEATALLLLTANPHLLPSTIVSRCQVLLLRPLPADAVAQEVVRRYGTEPAEAMRLARLSRGCLGWALHAAQNPQALQERAERLERIAGLLEASLEPRFAYAEELAARVSRDRPHVREELDLWLDWLEDLLLARHGLPDLALNHDMCFTLARQAAALSASELAQAARLVQETGTRLEENANPRLALEVLMLGLPRVPAQEAVS